MLSAILAAATAAGSCQPDVSKREMPAVAREATAFAPKGWTVDSVNQPDLNGDKATDLVVISRHPENEARRLVAAVATPRGYRNVGEAALPGYPLGEAQVEFTAKGVLVVTDLTGGTTANNAVMRYRYEGPSAAVGAMRYIGLDLTNYSRTNQHDSIELSFNWLTGDVVRQRNKLTKKAYAPQKPVRTKGEARCRFMEDTADPDDLFSTEMGYAK